MPGTRRIMVCMPESLLAEVDELLALESGNRSEFIREATELYLAERKRLSVREAMMRGYQEMAQLNLALVQEHFELENEVQDLFREVNLATYKLR